jgi:type II secretory pathway predicted ATPase ExeA
VYLRFYGLKEKPFNPTPDPRFLYLTAAHREALAQLEYGVKERRGFMVLIGEVGTGKTTLLRTLLDRLDSQTETAFVFNSMMSFDQILAYIVEDFGIVGAKDSHAHRLVALNHFLIERVRRGLNTVLIIDEAQNLDAASLEQVRLLSNFETTNEKLLQILLVGQPELKTKLALPELRQLKQRIGLRSTIHPLSPADTAEYIQHRLAVAGADDATRTPIFTGNAVERICVYSRGIPRVVNLVCDHCLIAGYADQNRTIDVRTVEEAIDYLEERERPTPEPRRPARRPEAPRDPSSKPREREVLPERVPVAPQPETTSRQGATPQPFRAVDTPPAPKVEEAEGDRPLSEAFSPAKVEAFSPTKVEAFSPAKAPSNRWMVSAGTAAAAGSAVLLALAPSLALGFVNRVAGSLQGLTLLAGNWLGTLIGSQPMLS